LKIEYSCNSSIFSPVTIILGEAENPEQGSSLRSEKQIILNILITPCVKKIRGSSGKHFFSKMMKNHAGAAYNFVHHYNASIFI